MPDRMESAPGLTAEGAPTRTITNAPSLPLTPAACREWEAAAPLDSPEYWLGRSHGYAQGYYDGAEDLAAWRAGLFGPLRPGVVIEMTAAQAHGRREVAR